MGGRAEVTYVLAALDRGPAAKPVLAMARGIAGTLGTGMAALHVQVDGLEAPLHLAARAGVPLRIARGDVVARLVEAAEAGDVEVLVIGARGIPADPRPLGTVAVAVTTTVSKPVAVVPPHADPRPTCGRVLVPIEGDVATSPAIRSLIERAVGAGVEVVVLHVLELDAMPMFTDQPQHEHGAWEREFLARHCPWESGTVRFELRLGRSDEVVPTAARDFGCDLIVLGWSQDFTPGHARVVRAALERSSVPVVLVAVRAPTDAPAEAPAPRR
jgi:nucleotide-binding universal stress UspA family protein